MIHFEIVGGVEHFSCSVSENAPTTIFAYKGVVYPKPSSGALCFKDDGSRYKFNGSAWKKIFPISEDDDVVVKSVTASGTVKAKKVHATDPAGISVKSSTADSTKKMKISVIDDGTVSAEEDT